MTNYQRGYAFECRVMKHLESDDFFCVASRGSHGPADIVAIKSGWTLLIQCKRDGRISKEDWQELFLLSVATNTKALLYYTPKRGVISFIEIGQDFTPPSLPSGVRRDKKSTRKVSIKLQQADEEFLQCSRCVV